MKFKIISSEMKLVEEREYYTVKICFLPRISLEELAEKNPNVDYDPQLDRGKAKVVCEGLGTIILWKDGARIPKLPKSKGNQLNVSIMEEYLTKMLNGEQRSFKQWLKADMKGFAKEIGVIE